MSALAHETTFRYPFPSQLVGDDAATSRTLRLATFTEDSDDSPYFFEGTITNPRRTADLLRGLMQIVHARFHVPAIMLGRILRQSDPVVTSSENHLRFEGFSACCGACVCVDLLPTALDGQTMRRGTTNVDFNQPMLNELAKIKSGDEISLSVGADKVVLKKDDSEIVEKKVKLPVRWLKGFVEVQSVQARMEKVHELDSIQAFRFFRSLPRVKTHRHPTWVVSSGKGLRLSQVESAEGVRIGGLQRLRVLEGLSKDAELLSIYSDRKTGASAWVLTFSDCRFHLIISPEVWRGFSGEGQALESIAKSQEHAIAKVQAQLKWQNEIEVEAMAKRTSLSTRETDDALRVLGTRGLVGYDVLEGTYFHREMPFDISSVAKLQPRIQSARKLLDGGFVSVHKQSKSSTELLVRSGDVKHRVRLSNADDDDWKCTCPWFAKHRTERGPCKHILAAQIYLEEKTSD